MGNCIIIKYNSFEDFFCFLLGHLAHISVWFHTHVYINLHTHLPKHEHLIFDFFIAETLSEQTIIYFKKKIDEHII